jgi:hypothetical protein
MKFRLIADQRETLSVRVMCDVLELLSGGVLCPAWQA